MSKEQAGAGGVAGRPERWERPCRPLCGLGPPLKWEGRDVGELFRGAGVACCYVDARL